jgi:hypothetical protein
MTEEECRTNAPVAVVDQRAAALMAPDGNAIGMLAADGQVKGVRTERRVIGIVQRLDFFGRSELAGYAFVPQDPLGLSPPSLFWRGEVDQKSVDAMRARLHDIEPRAVLTSTEFQPYESRFGEPRLLARITGALGLLALILTVTGAYAVTSYTVAGRTAEIGIRMALGATAGGVKRMIMRETLIPAAIGVLIGLACASLWAKTIETLLFQLTSRDLGVYAGSATVVLSVVAIAGAIPTARASRINPTDALRAD